MRILFTAKDFAGTPKRFSRRGFVLSLAAATPAFLALKSARAQGDVWHEYRPAGAPFRIDMPGQPEVDTEQAIYQTEPQIKSVAATVEYEKAVFGVNWIQWRGNQTVERLSAAWRDATRLWGPVTRETPFSVEGFPARELIGGSDKFFYFITRILVMGQETIQIFVNSPSDAGVHESPAARRFIESFKLQSAR